MKLSDWPHLFRPARDPAATPLLLLHGTGGTEHDLVGLADRVSPGSALLAPRGRVSERGAARFFPRLGEGVFDPAQIIPRIDELAGFVEAATREYGLTAAGAGRGLVALGFSNGANAAAALLQLHPDTPISGAVLLRPMVVLDRAATAVSLSGRRVLLLNGALDPIVPADHPARLAALLGSGGATVETVVHPEAGHGLAAEDLARANAFFANA
jgi:phospholipase/carboxylesterase